MMLRLSLFLWLSLIFLSCTQTEKKVSNPETATEKSTTAAPDINKKKTIVFFGNSLTAGYGLTNVSSGYVSLIQVALDSLDLPYRAVNAGLSGETSAGGNDRVDWVLKQPVDVFVLELGGNDALRGIQPEETIKNLGSIFDKVKAKYPAAKLVLAGMQAPPNMGKMYTDKFRAMYPKLAKEHGAALIPFLLENVGGIPELNQGDRIHPNEKGQYILRDNVWKVLSPML
ncbi:MAG: arylesterase [Saprospiraceae bacterium]|nr:arylesterase [Saprospiraceae bacterium]MCF8252648.1 arylesterase [Saprospiraceae bacterium]MCF8282838.1 arylesterase [Bacteroidales bacterium]MCF8314211.1 arylesterase [Saprospiraceae bacterium]MCF8443027.1 arylesterase [Saprospiraceae bacterium]